MNRIKFANQQAHRDFRRNIGAMATLTKDTTRTLKFPLEAPEQGWPFEFEQAQSLFNTTEGVGKGSLVGLLFTVLSSRFRAFSSAGNTKLFRSQSILPMAEFTQAFSHAFDVPANQFTPSGLIEYFSKEKRNKKDAPLELEDLTSELYKLARKKDPKKDGKSPHATLFEACELIAKLIMAEISHWKALRHDVPLVLKAVDTALASLGHHFPQLQACTSALKELEPDSSSIDYAPNALASVNEPAEPILPYVALAAQCHGLIADGEEVNAKSLQARMTTATNNALSWLFGSGLVHWCNTELDELCRQYQVPSQDRWCVERIQQWAKALPTDELYGEKNFAKYRSSVGGKVDSWIANTVKRLQDLETTLAAMEPSELKLPPLLQEPDLAPLFSGQSITPESWNSLIDQLIEQQSQAKLALARILGQKDELPTQADIEAYEQFSALLDAMYGELAMLRNRLNQESENPNSEFASTLRQLELPKPKWLKAMPKIPTLSGGVPDHVNELMLAGERFNLLSASYEQQLAKLVEKVEWKGIVAGVQRRESQHLKRHPKFSELKFDELSHRRLLDQYLQTIQKCPEALRADVMARLQQSALLKIHLPQNLQEKDKTVFTKRAQQRKWNAILLNGKGRLYVSPYSRGRHQAIEIEPTTLLKMDLLAWLENDMAIIDQLEANTPEIAHRARLELMMLKGRWALMLLPNEVNSDLLLPNTQELLPLPSLLAAYLDSPIIPRDQCDRLINLYISELRGLITVLFRERFFLRTRFVRVGDNKLFYKPKLNSDSRWCWVVPERVLNGKTEFCQWLQAQPFSASEIEFDGLKALKQQAGAQWQRSSTTFGRMLQQLPHDWCINLGFDKKFNSNAEEVFELSKTKLGNPAKQHQICRLVGTSAFKGKLDKQLVNGGLTHGDYTLIIEQHYKQSVSFNNGQITPVIEKDHLHLEVALPLTETAPEAVQFALSETYIGIDLGEVGIGYAVVNSKTHELMDYGSIRLRSIRHLIRSVRDHRKKKQPSQKFAQRFDTSLMELRENVTGDVCQAIDALMARYQGIPVLESSVRNLSSGSKQLALVYDKVLNHYVYSDIDAHKAARRHFWFGAENWEHPFAIETIKDRKTENASAKEPQSESVITRPLKLFPGVQVHPAGTSQVCSCCERNPYELLKAAYPKGQRLKTDCEGVLDLGDVKLHLVRNSLPREELNKLSQQQRKKYRDYHQQCKRRKERPEFLYPLANTTLDFDGAKRAVRSQLRRAQTSTRSKDTTQSVYVCCIEGCGHTMHADENAAINIVNKWLNDKKISKPEADEVAPIKSKATTAHVEDKEPA